MPGLKLAPALSQRSRIASLLLDQWKAKLELLKAIEYLVSKSLLLNISAALVDGSRRENYSDKEHLLSMSRMIQTLFSGRIWVLA